MATVLKSRCMLAVISPGFIVDEWCRFCFETTVRDAQVDVVCVLYGGITTPSDSRLDAKLHEEVCYALRKSRRCFVWPIDDSDLVNGDTKTIRKVDQFWATVRLAISSRREADAEKHERMPLLA